MEKRMDLPAALVRHREAVSARLGKDTRLAQMYEQCFGNALETTALWLKDGELFLYTGDIHAMWNRDAAEQMSPYLAAAEDSEVRALLRGVLRCQFRMIRRDPYANSFHPEPLGHHWGDRDTPVVGSWVWEQKYETDTLMYPLRLAFLYYDKTGDAAVFDDEFVQTVALITEQLILEQHHEERSGYTHSRKEAPWIDTLQNGGHGYPVKYTGMTWQGFRPSDDATVFGYHIPSNLMIVALLRRLMALSEELTLFDEALVAKMHRLTEEIAHGIEDFGVVLHPTYGRIYAYETDGFGNHLLMDDANAPSLLSLPYLGVCTPDDPLYQNTRRFILSEDNPYYYKGKYMQGLGSPHTPPRYVWPMGLMIQALTSTDKEEVRQILTTLTETDAGTGFMHESVCCDDPAVFTRPWFAAVNSLFAETVEWALEQGYLD